MTTDNSDGVLTGQIPVDPDDTELDCAAPPARWCPVCKQTHSGNVHKQALRKKEQSEEDQP